MYCIWDVTGVFWDLVVGMQGYLSTLKVNHHINYLYIMNIQVSHLFIFLCCPAMRLYVLNSVLWCPLRYPHKTMSCSSLLPVVCRRVHVFFMFIYVICICLRIVLILYRVFLRLVYVGKFLWIVHLWLPFPYSTLITL